MSIMSITQTLELAIESINYRDDIPPSTKDEAIQKLDKLKKKDYYISWTKESIIEKLNEWYNSHGYPPTVTNLSEAGMPHSATIRQYFNMSPATLLRQLFPETIKLHRTENSWGYKSEDDWIRCFKIQYEKHLEHMVCRRVYNTIRDRGTPALETICKHTGCSGWSELKQRAGIKCAPKTVTPIITDVHSPFLERYEALNKERKEHLQELYEFATKHQV